MDFEGDFEVEASCASASKNLVIYQQNLEQFARSLASCYSKHDNDHREVTAVRTQIVYNTQLYRELHLPASIEFIRGLRELMRSYTDFTASDFAKCIEDVVEEASSYRHKAQLVKDLHVNLHNDCKDLVDAVQKAASKLSLDAKAHQDDAEWLEMKTERYEEKAEKGKTATKVLCVTSIVTAVPTLGLGVVPFLAGAAVARGYTAIQGWKKDLFSSLLTAEKEDAKNALDAAEEIAGPMSECVRMFTNAIEQATLFFIAIHDQLQTFKQQADHALTKEQEQAKQRQIEYLYKKMKTPAANLLGLCNGFLGVAPIIEAELERLCLKDENHTTYIQEWLEEHEKRLKLLQTLDCVHGKEPSNNWEVVKRWCPSVEVKYDLNAPACFWVEMIMDNRFGAGTVKQEISVEELVRMASRWTAKRTQFKTLFDNLTMVGSGGKGVANLKRATEAAEKTSAEGDKQLRTILAKKMTLEAEAGNACRYRITLNVFDGCISGADVQALPIKRDHAIA